MLAIRRAVVSVTDKTGLVDFAKGLREFGVHMLSTGGTAKLLRDHQVEITEVSDYTGFPEMLDGRVKTLHPKIHGGILGIRENDAHVKTMAATWHRTHRYGGGQSLCFCQDRRHVPAVPWPRPLKTSISAGRR